MNKMKIKKLYTILYWIICLLGCCYQSYKISILFEYYENDVNNLMLYVMKFRKLFREITSLYPITRAFTLASIGLEVFKTSYLKESALAITLISGYSSIKNHSTTGNIWLDLAGFKNMKK